MLINEEAGHHPNNVVFVFLQQNKKKTYEIILYLVDWLVSSRFESKLLTQTVESWFVELGNLTQNLWIVKRSPASFLLGIVLEGFSLCPTLEVLCKHSTWIIGEGILNILSECFRKSKRKTPSQPRNRLNRIPKAVLEPSDEHPHRIS